MPPSTTAGSQKARDIGLIRAAFRSDARWNNTWEILHLYNKKAKGSPSEFSTFDRTWIEIEAHEKPFFELGDRAVHLFKGAVDRMVVYERDINLASSQVLKSKFEQCLDSVGDMRYIQTAFLSRAFNERRERVVRVFEYAGDDFLAAWAELEASDRYNKPVFSMDAGWTHPASPLVTWLQKKAEAEAGQ